MKATKGDFGRQLGKAIREHARLEADVRALASILMLAEQQDQPPYGWLATLKALRLESEYQKIAGQHDALISELEKASDVMDIEHLLSTIPPAPYLN